MNVGRFLSDLFQRSSFSFICSDCIVKALNVSSTVFIKKLKLIEYRRINLRGILISEEEMFLQFI